MDPPPPPGGMPTPGAADVAHRAGAIAGQLLGVLPERVLETPMPRPRYYVVLRGVRPWVAGIGIGHWELFRGYVEIEGEIVPCAVFHSFATHKEALLYWGAALPGVPTRYLNPWDGSLGSIWQSPND